MQLERGRLLRKCGRTTGLQICVTQCPPLCSAGGRGNHLENLKAKGYCKTNLAIFAQEKKEKEFAALCSQ